MLISVSKLASKACLPATGCVGCRCFQGLVSILPFWVSQEEHHHHDMYHESTSPPRVHHTLDTQSRRACAKEMTRSARADKDAIQSAAHFYRIRHLQANFLHSTLYVGLRLRITGGMALRSSRLFLHFLPRWESRGLACETQRRAVLSYA